MRIGPGVAPSREDPDDLSRYGAVLRGITERGGLVLAADLSGEVILGGPASSSASDISRLAACVLRSSRFKCIRLIRSRGRHGWLLVGDAVARARALGCYRLQLTSNGGRHDAQRFYERLGFAPQVGFKVVPRGESD